jgi:hypothetical protein
MKYYFCYSLIVLPVVRLVVERFPFLLVLLLLLPTPEDDEDEEEEEDFLCIPRLAQHNIYNIFMLVDQSRKGIT